LVNSGWRANEIGTASNSAEKKNRPHEGVAEGGFGGNSARRAQRVPFGYFQTDTASWEMEELLK